MTRRLSVLLSSLAFLLALSPLGSDGGVPGESPHRETSRSVRDEIGRRVRVPLHPRRIVSLAPSVTETLFALGAGDTVVGVTEFCDYPPAAGSKARIGGMVNPSWEAIVDLEPDLVLATTAGNDRNLVAQAEALRLPLFFLNTPDIGSLLESLTRLGELVGSPDRARALRDALAGRLESLERRNSAGPRPRVLFLVWTEPIVVPGKGTFLDDALRRAGCESISSDGPPGWPTYDLETVLLRNPRWILAAAQNASFLDGLRERPGWRSLEAVQRGRVAVVSPALERPAPRVIEAMEQLQELLEKGEKK